MWDCVSFTRDYVQFVSLCKLINGNGNADTYSESRSSLHKQVLIALFLQELVRAPEPRDMFQPY